MPGVSAGLNRTVLACLDKQADRRPRSAQELADWIALPDDNPTVRTKSRSGGRVVRRGAGLLAGKAISLLAYEWPEISAALLRGPGPQGRVNTPDKPPTEPPPPIRPSVPEPKGPSAEPRQRARQLVAQGDALASTFRWPEAMDAYATANGLDPAVNKVAKAGYVFAQSQLRRDCSINPAASVCSAKTLAFKRTR